MAPSSYTQPHPRPLARHAWTGPCWVSGTRACPPVRPSPTEKACHPRDSHIGGRAALGPASMNLQILACGLLLLFTSLASPLLQKLPVSTAMLYLGVGLSLIHI